MLGNKSSQAVLFLSLGLFFILAVAVLMPIQPNDYWWYMRIGEEVSRSGALPTTEILSYTQAGAPVAYQSWLAGWVFHLAHTLGGAPLTNLLRAALIAAFCTFTWLACRELGGGARLASLLMLLAALAGSNNWAIRPQMFAYPLFGLALWLLLRWENGRRDHALWLLPLAALLWINLHGSFLLLFALLAAGLVAGKGDRRRLLLVAVTCLLATFLNPRGPAEWLNTLAAIGNPSSQGFSREWDPPALTGWQMGIFFGWLLLFPLLAGRSPVKLNRLHWLLFFGFGALALTGLRYVVWFTAVMAALSAALLAPLAEKLEKRGSLRLPAINLALTLFLLLSPLALLPCIRDLWWSAAPPAYSENTPIDAAEYLKGRPDLPGEIWADLAFSSYLTYALPERPVWIHTRFETFPPEQWQDYLTVTSAAPGWEQILRRDGVHLLLLSKADQPNLIRVLLPRSDWQPVYEDEAAIFFIGSY